ncbi:hypothetical protein SAMN04515647_3729 [Cohaesibacter sp. ES.047]|uniref:hypothetical protein n=1 Tax=Cohaesibacter sp. ES.047 TaxID=1798205 RepID=UPI000BB74D09|nr:hypothetical protein [Cohaesibacter sp. ES.047]SNY93434.1 hypothetical protein SAMN04515647_3729 [Cohaesibacter sp. ES.047]
MHKIVLTLLLAIWSNPSYAGWEFLIDEDPFEDTKIAAAMAASDFNQSELVFKCWQGIPSATLMGISIANEPDIEGLLDTKGISIDTRVDKGKVRSFKLSAQFFKGNTMLLTLRAGSDSNLFYFFKDVGAAKKTIAIRLRERIHTFPVEGSTVAIREMINTCEMPPPPPEK